MTVCMLLIFCAAFLCHPLKAEASGSVAVEIEQKSVTMQDLQDSDRCVPIAVNLVQNPGITAVEFGIRADCNFTLVTDPNLIRSYGYSPVETQSKDIKMTCAMTSTSDFAWCTWASGDSCTGTGTLVVILAEIPEYCTGGEFFYFSYADQGISSSGKASHQLWKNDSRDYVAEGLVQYMDGGVEIEYSMIETTTTSTAATTTTKATTSTTTTNSTTTTTTSTTTTTTRATTATTTKATTATTRVTTLSALTVNQTKISLQPGDQFQIIANQTNLTYKSSNQNTAIVSKSGVITAMEAGTANITVFNADFDAVVIKVTVSETAEPAETAPLLPGDVSGDGKINILDVISVNKAVLGKASLTSAQLDAVDFNHNNKPDSEEALAILKYIVGLVQSLAETPANDEIIIPYEENAPLSSDYFALRRDIYNV